MKKLLLIAVLSIMITGCSNDDEKGGNDNSHLAREWNLVTASNGWEGASNYEVGEIKWKFTTQNEVIVTIAQTVELNGAIPFQQNGTYVYGAENETITLEDSGVTYTYWIEFDDTLNKDVLYLDGMIAADGPGLMFVEN
ncbi:MAG: hypothetical protein WCY89_09245 [Flavobacteriaceae bacterium]